MPRGKKRTIVLNDAIEYGHARKRTCRRRLLSSFLDDVSESVHTGNSGDESDGSLSSISSISSISLPTSLRSEDSQASENGSDNHTASSDGFDDFEAFMRRSWEQQFYELLKGIETSRVFDPKDRVPKVSQLALVLGHFKEHDEERFRKKLRVSPATFDYLVELIEPHSIFYNNSNNPQLPVDIQLAIFLARVGHYGNAASPEDLAQWAGVSSGTVANCTARVMVAILSHHDDAVHLPTAAEKEEAKQWVEAVTKCSEWRDGFLMIDGTKIPLFEKPGLHGEAYFDKDKNYSVDTQVCFFVYAFNLSSISSRFCIQGRKPSEFNH